VQSSAGNPTHPHRLLHSIGLGVRHAHIAIPLADRIERLRCNFESARVQTPHMEAVFTSIGVLLFIDSFGFVFLIAIDFLVIGRNCAIFRVRASYESVLDTIHRVLARHDSILLLLLDNCYSTIVITSPFTGLDRLFDDLGFVSWSD
jgi:hypothetical protein